MKWVRGLAMMVLLFLAVYVPTFGAVGLFAPDLGAQAVALIVVSFALASAYLAMASVRHEEGMAAYGLAAATGRHMLWALVAGIVLAGLTRLSFVAFDVGPRFGFDTLAPWQTVLLFWIGAPVQEELIFRGLLQSSLECRVDGVIRIGRTRFSPAAVVVAVLFGLTHLLQGPAFFPAAMLLGLLAGHLRWASGSLAPAILVHALFNIVVS